MKAIGNNVIILPTKLVVDKTKGGLLLIEKDKENIRYKEAIVFSVSEDITAIKEGYKIFYDKHAGHGIELNGEQYTIIKLQDIVVVL